MSSWDEFYEKYEIDPTLHIPEIVKKLNECAREIRKKIEKEFQMKNSAYIMKNINSNRSTSKFKHFIAQESTIIEQLMSDLKEINDNLGILQTLAIDSELNVKEDQISFLVDKKQVELRVMNGAKRLLDQCDSSKDKKTHIRAKAIHDSSQLKIDVIDMRIQLIKNGQRDDTDRLMILERHFRLQTALLSGTNNMLMANDSKQRAKQLRENVQKHQRKIQLLDLTRTRLAQEMQTAPDPKVSYRKPVAVTGTVNFCLKSITKLIDQSEDDVIRNIINSRRESWIKKYFKKTVTEPICSSISIVFNIDGVYICSVSVNANGDCNDWAESFKVTKGRELEIEVYRDTGGLVAISYIPLDEYLGANPEVVSLPLYPKGLIQLNLTVVEPLIGKITNPLKRNTVLFTKGQRHKNRRENSLPIWTRLASVLFQSEHKTEIKEKKVSTEILPNGNISDLSDVTEYIKSCSIYEESVKENGLNIDDFELCCVLGRGHFGKVILGREKRTGNHFAVKGLKKYEILLRNELDGVISELEVLRLNKGLQNPFLVHLHGYFQTESHVCLVMDYMPGGDLMRQIHMSIFNEAQTVFYTACATLGIKFLHERKIMYRDLKLDNLVMNIRGYIKIADFGLCKLDVGHGDRTNTFCGTPEFIAPEMLTDTDYNNAVDWWELGVLVYEMLYTEPPFSGENEDEIFDNIVNEIVHFPRGSSRNCVDFIKRLLNKIPEFRFGSSKRDALEIMEHKFFSKIDWNALYTQKFPAPFVPSVKNVTDVSCFDEEFTGEVPALSPCSSSNSLSAKQQSLFHLFS